MQSIFSRCANLRKIILLISEDSWLCSVKEDKWENADSWITSDSELIKDFWNFFVCIVTDS